MRSQQFAVKHIDAYGSHARYEIRERSSVGAIIIWDLLYHISFSYWYPVVQYTLIVLLDQKLKSLLPGKG